MSLLNIACNSDLYGDAVAGMVNMTLGDIGEGASPLEGVQRLAAVVSELLDLSKTIVLVVSEDWNVPASDTVFALAARKER